jgi:hypothetical protein
MGTQNKMYSSGHRRGLPARRSILWPDIKSKPSPDCGLAKARDTLFVVTLEVSVYARRPRPTLRPPLRGDIPGPSAGPRQLDISGDVGLVSAGRIDKDTPPLTTPGHTSRSSAMDTSSHTFQIAFRRGPRGTLPSSGGSPPCKTLGPEAYSCSLYTHEGGHRRFPARILT